MLVVQAWRIAVVVAGFLVLVYGLILLPRSRPLAEYLLTTGLLSLLLAVSVNELYDFNQRIDLALIASTAGIVLTGVGLIWIRR